MTVICYVRPKNEKQFSVICQAAFPYHQIHYISDHPKHNSMFQEQLVSAFERQRRKAGNMVMLDEQTFLDVIQRCRLLRKLSFSMAQQLVNACIEVVDAILDKHQPKYVIGLTVDNYIVDIIRILSKKRLVDYIGLVPTFINGYCRLTSRGEYIKIRTVKEDEVNDIYKKLVAQKEKPAFLKIYNKSDEVKNNWINSKIKGKLRYYYMKVQRLRNLSYYHYYHYWAGELYGQAKKSKINMDFFRLEFQVSSEQPSCYIPLQHFPEATVDYWVQDQCSIDYYNKLIEVILYLSNLQINIYIKEHPNSLGIRPEGFYQQLKSFENVILLSPCIDSNIVILKTDFTLVWTGSAGAEAYLMGKSVVHIGDPYYIHDEDEFIKFTDTFVVPRKRSDDRIEKGKLLIRHILEGSIRAPFYHDFDKREKNKAHDEMMILGEKIKEYLVCFS